MKMRGPPSIHLVRGSIAHSALEHLYDIVPEVITENYREDLKLILSNLLQKYWMESRDKLLELGMTEDQLTMYFLETQDMLTNHLMIIIKQVEKAMAKGFSFAEAFRKVTPEREIEYKDWDLWVMGYVDVIENWDGKVRLMDYKTSKKSVMSDQYKLQLAIYALLYKIKHGKLPDEVGIYFLKDGSDKNIPATEELAKEAQFQIEQVHASVDTDKISDYPKKTSPLCKWSNGQCEFYEYCFEGKEVPKEPVRKSRTPR